MVGAGLFVYGVPGMVEDYQWWASAFAQWQIHNFLMVGVGIILFIYGGMDIWRWCYAKLTTTEQEKAPEKKKSLKSLWKKLPAWLRDNIVSSFVLTLISTSIVLWIISMAAFGRIMIRIFTDLGMW